MKKKDFYSELNKIISDAQKYYKYNNDNGGLENVRIVMRDFRKQREIEYHIEIDCPSCGQNTLFRHCNIMSGPYGGLVACHSCDYRRGSYQFLGEQMIKVEPMPKGAF